MMSVSTVGPIWGMVRGTVAGQGHKKCRIEGHGEGHMRDLSPHQLLGTPSLIPLTPNAAIQFQPYSPNLLPNPTPAI